MSKKTESEKIEMQVMDHTGDTTYTFDPNSTKEVDAARETFEAMKKRGFAAFKLRKWKDRGEVLHAFDPKVHRILFVPPMSGG